MKNQGLRWLKLLAIAILALPAFATQSVSAQANCRTFTETGHQVCNTFLNYWTNNGALAQDGYPITDPVVETSDTDGKIYTVQYFERAVFEEHPEFAGTQNEVLLQLLGVFFYQSRYPGGATGQTPNAEANSQLFPETGHKLGGTFQVYWTSHGALRQQGYPISDEFVEVNQLDGRAYRVQYFRRARCLKSTWNSQAQRMKCCCLNWVLSRTPESILHHRPWSLRLPPLHNPQPPPHRLRRQRLRFLPVSVPTYRPRIPT